MKRYFYHIENRNANSEVISAFIIKAKDFTEALNLIQCKIKNKKLSYDKYNDISERVGIMIRRISKEEKAYYLEDSFSTVKYVKNINFERSKLNAYGIIENGIDFTSRIYQVSTVYAKNKKQATKIANKEGKYGIGKMGFYSIKKIENTYK